MNSSAPPPWHQNLHEDGLMPPASVAEDFTTYLDLDLDFSGFDAIEPDNASMSPGLEGYMNPQTGLGQDRQTEYRESNPTQDAMQQQQRHLHQIASLIPNQQQTYRPAHQYQTPRTIIPPTPTSSELHGGAAAYYQSASGHMRFEFPNKDEQMSFTPLVSPAVTPVDAVFQLPEYAVPGEYLSPLTSPAIEAQHFHQRQFQNHYGPKTGSSTPTDANVEPLYMSAPPTPVATKQRRKPSMSKIVSRSVRQSPIVKPQSKRKSQRNLNPAAVAEVAEVEQNEETRNARPSVLERTMGSESSGQDSVSPEALAEALMPPPALPHTRSPAIVADIQSPFMKGKEPATPATLMRLQKDSVSQSPLSGQPLASSDLGLDMMEDIMLPEPATSVRPSVAPINTSAATLDNDSTPVLSARDSQSRLGSRSAGASNSSTPIALTPRSKDINSPDGNTPKRTKPGGRMSKKRQSVSAPQISPAIRPKISPNIKPLMPIGATASAAEHSALYLASKSNYQNIVDGTHLPGVTYPEALAENLSSKRTSHKIAEQGRRNRINTALKEIEALLPPTPAIQGEKAKEASGSSEADAPTDKEKSSSHQTTSKANTVEMAITYIKQLQAELEDTRSRLEKAEKKLAEGPSSNGQVDE